MMRLTTMLVLLCVLYLSSTSIASDTPPTQGLASGIALMESGRYAEAVTVLRKVVSDTPDDPEANFYLGKALNRLADKEAETYLKKSLMLTPDSAAANLELGEVYFNRNVYAEAADYFENAQTLAPGSEQARKAGEFLKRMDRTKKISRWDINLLTGMQYDSNVIVNGNGLLLPAGISHKSDWSGILGFRGNYTFIRNDTFELKGGYSLYQSLHTRLDNFDITQNLFELRGSYFLSPKVKLMATYGYEYLLLGGHQYDDAHNLAPSLVFDLGQWGSTNIGYRYSSTSFKNSGLFEKNSDRSGHNHLGEIIHILPLGKYVSVWASYAHDGNSARIDIWDYQGDKVLAGVRAALPFEMTGDMYGEYYHRDYGGVDPTYGISRDDAQYSLSVALTKKITNYISLVLSELYTRNHSNIRTFDYERSLTGLFMNVRFYE